MKTREATMLRRIWNRAEFAASSAWQNFWRNATVSVAGLLIVWVVLLALGSLLLGLHSLDEVVNVEKSRASVISIFLADTTPLSSAMDFKAHLERDPRVSAVTYVTKDQAMEKFRQMPALSPEVVESLGTNPLPASLDVTVHDIRDLAAIDKEVRTSPLVDKSPATHHEPSVMDKIILLARVAGGPEPAGRGHLRPLFLRPQFPSRGAGRHAGLRHVPGRLRQLPRCAPVSPPVKGLRLPAAILVLVLLTGVMPSDIGDLINNAQGQLNGINGKIGQMQTELGKLAAEDRALKAQIVALDSQLVAVANQIREEQGKLQVLNDQVDAAKVQLAQKEAELADHIAQMGARMRHLYKSGSISGVELVFSAVNFVDLLNRALFFADIVREDNRQVDQLRLERREVAGLKADLEVKPHEQAAG